MRDRLTTSSIALTAGRSRSASTWPGPAAAGTRLTATASPLLGGRRRRHGGLHLLGPAAARRIACPTRSLPWGCARRSHRHHSAAAPGNRRRPYRLLPDGGGGDAAVGPVRPGCARVPAAEQRNGRRAGRYRRRCPTFGTIRDRLPALKHVIGVDGARESGALLGDAARAGVAQLRLRRIRRRRSPRFSSTPAAPPARPRAR